MTLKIKLEEILKEASRIKGLSRSSYNLGNSSLGNKLFKIHANIFKLVDEVEKSAEAGEFKIEPQMTMNLN